MWKREKRNKGKKMILEQGQLANADAASLQFIEKSI